MTDSDVRPARAGSAQATHHLHMNPTTFRALAQAVFNLSVQELAMSSPRRIVTHVLETATDRLLRLNISELEALCQLHSLSGNIRLNIRLDTDVNDRLREFREYAEQQLGRSVSVLEAVNACIFVINEKRT